MTEPKGSQNQLWTALASGTLFGVGLAVAGMTQPMKVVAFLDFFGDWDPSLAFVMGGAILVYLPAYRAIHNARTAPVLEPVFHLPSKTSLDAKLFVGSALFGVGWGMGGYCPGPALTSLVSLTLKPLVFVVAMLVGIAVARAFEDHPKEAAAAAKAAHTTAD